MPRAAQALRKASNICAHAPPSTSACTVSTLNAPGSMRASSQSL
jgi:hypothetical protein